MNKDILKQYNRIETENKWKKYWAKKKIFKFKSDNKKPLFIVDTPPPYVSADHLHIGHIMSYAQAEFIVRYKRMKGFNVFYPMGFDDNGLPTEKFVEKKYKINKSKIARSDFIKLCLKETEIGSKTYKNLWNNIGISVDWSKTYSTISPIATKVSQWSLIDLYKKGGLSRKKAPVLWCTSCKTAIAQAELEDKESESKMNYIKFKSKSGKNLTIATTRPELIPACVALYINPKDKRYAKLKGQRVIVPLFNYNVPIHTNENVDMETGTGLMMVCTWGDKEDLGKWQKDKLDTRSLIQENGKLNKLGNKYEGMTINKAREEIISALKKEGYLVKQENIKHTLNVHERCGTPTEFVLSNQWFIKITDLKNTWLNYGKKLNWYPKSRIKDYELWVNSINWDWCISRQRYYGVPFPVWYCSKCANPIFANIKNLPINPIEDSPPINNCPKCNNKELLPETDVMDTWATSSCTPFLLKELVENKGIKKKLFPVTLRPNAFEIIRTWDFYSIVKGHYNFKKLPFQDIMISGHGLDEQGRKISKSIGNYVEAEKLIKDHGADAIRYWATGANLGQNLRFSSQEVKKGKRTTIKLWNVGRFLLMSLDQFNINANINKLEDADLWIITEFNTMLQKTTQAFDNYAYAKAKDEIDNFFWSKFADYYIEFIKYRLFGKDQQSKIAAQHTLSILFLAILKLYAPLLPFITEELYQQIFKDAEKKTSIHVSLWPNQLKLSEKVDLPGFMNAIKAIDEIRKYKSGKNISLGAELDNYELRTNVDLKKYGNFIKNTVRIKELL